MISADIYDHQKQVTGSIELDESVFGVDVNDAFLHQILLSYAANKRQGTASAKTRSEVAGTRSKPFRQKGTGRARQGFARACHYRGGNAQFGPQPRSFRQAIPKKMKREAFRQCLSMKAGQNQCFILNDLDFSEVKTKRAVALIEAFGVEGQALFVDVKPGDNVLLSVRNLTGASVLAIDICSPWDIFTSDHLFLSKAAAELFQARYAKQGGDRHAE